MLTGVETLSKSEQLYIEQFWREICDAGDELLLQTMPKLTKDDFWLFQKTGNRLVYENAYFGRRRFLTVFGMLAEYRGEKSDFTKLTEVLEEICKEECWALPAHVDFTHLDYHTIDLFAAETSATLAEMAFMFYEKLPQETIELMLTKVVDRVLIPFVFSKSLYGWETDPCNWSSVCAGNVGIAAIYLNICMKTYQSSFLQQLVEGLPTNWLNDCLIRVCNALHYYINGMEDDGACTEGLGYFSYGMSYFTAFVELLEETIKTDKDVNVCTELFSNPKLEKIASFQQKCYFDKGVSLCFSDGDSKEYFLPGLTTYLAHRYESVEVPDYVLARHLNQDACYRWITNERNIRWLLKYSKGQTDTDTEKSKEKAYLLPSAQWMIYQKENDDGISIGYAIKGGHNAENHNHNDVGSFLCIADGEILLADLGAGEYTKDYFGEKRYEILCNRSLGHNVPLINGTEQLDGNQYKASDFYWDKAKEMTVVSFEGAYKHQIIDKITRSICVDEENKILVSDNFRTNAETKMITENFVSYIKPELLSQKVQLAGEKVICNIEMNQSCQSQMRVVEKEHYLHNGKKEIVYLLQYDISCDEKKEITWDMKLSFEKKK